ncbi:unnamed protein product [Moneuplotes crassus]|uniref:Uncharacterized protein n=1 Tax=Euplotes crassus TaxID=5936 RepID=A0AAD1Y321_EUPCR|nr:unnamed protein product [Moneuplotes crassus]
MIHQEVSPLVNINNIVHIFMKKVFTYSYILERNFWRISVNTLQCIHIFSSIYFL